MAAGRVLGERRARAAHGCHRTPLVRLRLRHRGDGARTCHDREHCPGLTQTMLHDLLTPDEKPAGQRYEGDIRSPPLSRSSLATRRHVDRGIPQGVGVLRFHRWSCWRGRLAPQRWHPQRIFQGSRRSTSRPPGDVDDCARPWRRGGAKPRPAAGRPRGLGHARAGADLAPAIVRSAVARGLGAEPLHRCDLDNHGQLPELWGLMAVLRDWLNPLNKPGLRSRHRQGWLPVPTPGGHRGRRPDR